MDIAFRIYIAAWSAACLAAVLLYLRHPGDFAISRHAYWHFLAEPWKLVTFIAGTGLITLVAPYTGDPTWDYVDGFFMSVLCYATAPWVVLRHYPCLAGSWCRDDLRPLIGCGSHFILRGRL